MHRRLHVQNRVQLRDAGVALGSERLVFVGRTKIHSGVSQPPLEKQKEYFPYLGDRYIKEHQNAFTRVGTGVQCGEMPELRKR